MEDGAAPETEQDTTYVYAQVTHVIKWDQGRRTRKRAAVVDAVDCRSFVAGDYFNYVAQYLVPPLAYVLDKQAEYPLYFTRGLKYDAESEEGVPARGFSKISWMLGCVLLYVAALLPLILPTSRQITGIERYGVLLIVLLRSIALPYLEALNTKDKLHHDIPLAQYPVTYVDGSRHTAADLLGHIQASSKFHLRSLRFDLSTASVMSLLVGVGMVLISPVLRFAAIGSLFGKNVWDFLVVVCANVAIGTLVGVGFRAFFEAFALYVV